MSNAKRGRPVKEFHDYLKVDSGETHISHDDYVESPSTAFLKYCNHAKNAIINCQNNFAKNDDGSYNKKAHASLQRIVTAMLPALMGHFETYQRYLFAGVFDHSIYLNNFKPDKLFQELKSRANINLSIDPVRLSAYRGVAAPVGLMLADSLHGWHDPKKVNDFFKCFDFKTDFFTSDDIDRLSILWQLRHSIVHTGGSITIPDSKKAKGLESFAGIRIVFEDDFIKEVARKMHPLVRDSTGRIDSAFRAKQQSSLTPEISQRLDKLFQVKGTACWL